MIILLENGNQIRGDLINSAVMRSDLAPVPLTLEMEVRSGDEDFDSFLAQGRTLINALGDEFSIIKSERVAARAVQGAREFAGFRVTAILKNCLSIAYVRSRAVIRENVPLSTIYRASGASIRAIDADFPVPRFYCPIGETPSFHIARVLQEEGGVVRWKSGRLQFIRLRDLFRQKVSKYLSDAAADNVETGFLERHEVPSFFSLDDSGGFVYGNRNKPRIMRYSPFKNVQRLQNMTRCLVHKKTAKTLLNIGLCAGDLVGLSGNQTYVILTAAHVYKMSAEQGGASETFSRLWLGEVEE